MRNDDRDWDDIIEDEDNPFDNPDTTFELDFTPTSIHS